ncbi:MAG: Pycsar system effector family protein [Mangrovibacterium sp.]
MEVIEKVKLFVIDFFEKHPKQKLVFHTLEHTYAVVRSAETLGRAEALSDAEMQALLIAAWFHDTGYLVQLENHETASVQIAESFFDQNPLDAECRQLVSDAILATRRQSEPKNAVERVLLDADVSHVADVNFISISKKLKKERANYAECAVNFADYWTETLGFLRKLSFYTGYAKQNFTPQLEQNTELVEEMIAGDTDKETAKKDKKKQSTEKGVESMFRLTASNQMRLSSIADKKANILISINSILISVSVATVSRQLVSLDEMLPTVVILFVACLVSLVFAILSCRPEVRSSQVTDQQLKEKKANLLFFGNFIRIPYPKYETAVRDMMDDYEYLYRSLIRDQYYLGKSLYRKFKLLRMAYDVFMYGFILAAIVFVVSYTIW